LALLGILLSLAGGEGGMGHDWYCDGSLEKGRTTAASQSGDVQWQANGNSCRWYFKNGHY